MANRTPLEDALRAHREHHGCNGNCQEYLQIARSFTGTRVMRDEVSSAPHTQLSVQEAHSADVPLRHFAPLMHVIGNPAGIPRPKGVVSAEPSEWWRLLRVALVGTVAIVATILLGNLLATWMTMR